MTTALEGQKSLNSDPRESQGFHMGDPLHKGFSQSMRGQQFLEKWNEQMMLDQMLFQAQLREGEELSQREAPGVKAPRLTASEVSLPHWINPVGC